jgi:His/Glu/Gln/Arg/opine family amino acid ABC transporter permease subunit
LTLIANEVVAVPTKLLVWPGRRPLLAPPPLWRRFPVRVACVGAALLALTAIGFTLMGLDFALIWQRLPFLLGLRLSPSGFVQGAVLTLLITAISMTCSSVLALFTALGRLSRNPVAFAAATFYASFFRGTPLMVQVLLIYLALPQIGIVFDALTSGVLALSLNYGAYLAETVRAGIQSVPSGQWEAAKAHHRGRHLLDHVGGAGSGAGAAGAAVRPRLCTLGESGMTAGVILLDGGMGRELARIGAPFRLPEWSALALIEAPDLVRVAHASFVAAGADVITANNYAVTPRHLGAQRFATDGQALADRAGRLAREAARGGVRVAGSLPPLFASYQPERFDPVRAPAILAPLIAGLAPHVDLWLIETTSSIAEMRAAATAARAVPRPLWVSYTVADGIGRRGPPVLRSGEPIAEALGTHLINGFQRLRLWWGSRGRSPSPSFLTRARSPPPAVPATARHR